LQVNFKSESGLKEEICSLNYSVCTNMTMSVICSKQNAELLQRLSYLPGT